MKRFYLGLFTLLLSNALQAQDSHSLLSPGKSWQEQIIVPSEICQYGSGKLFFHDRDTLLEGHTYAVILSNPIVSLSNIPEYCPPYAIDTSAIVFETFLREDLNKQQVYIRKEEQDILLYDFSLQIGDTFYSPFATDGIELVISDTEEVELENGHRVKRLYLENGEYYTEELGGSQGVIGPLITGLGFSTEVQCVRKPDTIIYGQNCYDLISNQKELKPSELKAWYYSLGHKICFTGNMPFSTDIRLFGLNGHLLQAAQLIENECIQLSASIRSGIVFVQWDDGTCQPIWIP